MVNILVFILSIISQCICAEVLIQSKPSPTPFQDWDYIVYSQRWPITGCDQWKSKNSKNTCNMPEDTKTWTVHGIWPTKIGTDGPYFCNSALHFDLDQLQPMMKELEEYWPNIEANTKLDSFWKHEWNKHGTCASTLPQLNSVTNFFRQGLKWNRAYNLANLLNRNKIVPDDEGYNITDIYNSIKTATNKKPTVQCVIDGITKKALISEIRICFNKSLDLIDCDVSNPSLIVNGNNILSNCNDKVAVMYYAAVPNNTIQNELEYVNDWEPKVKRCIENYIYGRKLMSLYAVIKLLMWFTL